MIRDGTPIENIDFQNIIKGNFSKLTFNVKNESVLVKCIYAPNNDMTLSGPENESRVFFQKVFDDMNDKIIIGDFNVAPSHTHDSSGYLHINNQNSRDYLTRKIEQCDLTDIWRFKNPKSRQYTFGKKSRLKITQGPV